MSGPAIPCSGDKPRAYIEAWGLIRTSGSHHLIGFVFGHVRIPDTHLVVTSDIVDMHLQPGGQVIVETMNTLYALGEPVSALSVVYGVLLDEILGQDWRPMAGKGH